MTVIAYKKTNFNPPGTLSEANYLRFKSLLAQDPNFELIDDPQPFTVRYRRTLKNLSWMVPLCTVLSLTFIWLFPIAATAPDPLRMSFFIVILIIGLIALVLLTRMLLEGPSYATFLKNHRAYFQQMKADIVNSSDYDRFLQRFYPSVKKLPTTPVIEPPPSLERSLTNIFHFIDNYWWIVALAIMLAFFGRKLFV